MSSKKARATASPKTRRTASKFPADARERKVIVHLEMFTATPQNEIRAAYKTRPLPFSGRLDQVTVQAVRRER